MKFGYSILAGSVARCCAAAVFLGGGLAACGGEGGGDKVVSQTAAKVNKEEITVHQINAILAARRHAGENAEAQGRAVLERLIDQELALQKAAELKVDREPRVVQALEAARREIIARAYADKLGEGAAKPSAAEVKAYYQANPALFAERRVYQLHEFIVQAEPARVEALRAGLKVSKGPAEFAQQLNAAGLKFAANQAVRAAEQMPLAALPTLSKLSDGQAMMTPTPDGALVVFVIASRARPVSEERAAPVIEQFLHNERKRKIVGDDMKALRAAAKIEYVGKFAGAKPFADSASAPSVADAVASAAAGFDSKAPPVVLRPRALAASAVEAADAAVSAASAVDTTTIKKGLGLK
jgi:EpsD family peptidyl-prolyl cis-trans isomerase